MAENTNIEWADHTFNPWIGCTKISAACDNCYAEALMDHRLHWVNWGPGQPRSRTSDINWTKVLRWNEQAEITGGRRPRVFCASFADVFDAEAPREWFRELMSLIAKCKSLDFLLLTKRPERAKRWFNQTTLFDGTDWDNIWLGTTVEDQAMADRRIQVLLSTGGVAKRFLSMEPLLGAVDISVAERCREQLDWVIVGGESGRNARYMDPIWASHLSQQCDQFGIPFFMKQMSGTSKRARKDIPPPLMIKEFP